MKTAAEVFRAVLLSLAALILITEIVYGCYWMIKSLSYFFFYEGFVQQTVREMIKPEYLK